MLSCLVAQVLLGALLILLLCSTGVPIFRAHNLIDDAEPSSPRGLQALTAM
jgi:hypothetical protein